MKKINAPRTISQSRDMTSSGWIGFQGSDCSFHLPQGNLIRERAGLFAFVTLVCRRHTFIRVARPIDPRFARSCNMLLNQLVAGLEYY